MIVYAVHLENINRQNFKGIVGSIGQRCASALLTVGEIMFLMP